MPMTLIRRPRSPRVLHGIILDEVRSAYNALADDIIDTLKHDIANWSLQPEFFKTVNVGRKLWFVSVRYDKDSHEGEVYGWVDVGTGERGGGKPYDIFPVLADVLHFTVPHFPKTVATDFGIPGIVLQYEEAGMEDVITGAVIDHPGIWPRNFTQSVRDYYGARNRIGGFRSVSEAAIKRGARRIGV